MALIACTHAKYYMYTCTGIQASWMWWVQSYASLVRGVHCRKFYSRRSGVIIFSSAYMQTDSRVLHTHSTHCTTDILYKLIDACYIKHHNIVEGMRDSPCVVEESYLMFVICAAGAIFMSVGAAHKYQPNHTEISFPRFENSINRN